jgi:hypothetical protein
MAAGTDLFSLALALADAPVEEEQAVAALLTRAGGRPLALLEAEGRAQALVHRLPYDENARRLSRMIATALLRAVRQEPPVGGPAAGDHDGDDAWLAGEPAPATLTEHLAAARRPVPPGAGPDGGDDLSADLERLRATATYDA